jgi:predicted nucleic acid-binding protein
VIAVADTSPICYLILIGEIELLARLFDRLVVPKEVVAKLLHEEAPEAVRNWAHSLPSWVLVKDVEPAIGLEKLQAGERAAIFLAESVAADLVLLEEKAARRVATDRGLRVTGLLGVLSEAASLGLVDLPAAIDRLRTTNFRCSAALLKATLDRFAGR